MDIEHNHINQLLDWTSEHWPIFVFMFGGYAGAVWYSLHKVFATKKSHILLKSDMDACAARLQNNFTDAIRVYEAREDVKLDRRQVHEDERYSSLHGDIKEIRQDVRQLISKLIP